jgi:hypothetical protein
MTEISTTGAHEYLEKYIRTVPGGAIAWERSIFSHTGQWTASELVDAAVDLAWELFGPINGQDRPALDIHRAGNYFVISPVALPETLALPLAA